VRLPLVGFGAKKEVMLGLGALALLVAACIVPEPQHRWSLLCGSCFAGGTAIGHAWAGGGHSRLLPTAHQVISLLKRQRHDFLNHLQVISALAQLNKPERILEYIDQTNRELDLERSLTLRLPAEAGLTLLAWAHQLEENGIRLRVDLKTDLFRQANGPNLAALLKEITDAIGREAVAGKEKEVVVKGWEECGTEVLEIVAPGVADELLMHSNRFEELARTVPACLMVGKEKGSLSVTILPVRAKAPASARPWVVKS
jgi:hypothetical protein